MSKMHQKQFIRCFCLCLTFFLGCNLVQVEGKKEGSTSLKIQMTTWNVHQDELSDVKSLIDPKQNSPDIIVFGFQEVKLDLTHPDSWVKKMHSYLSKFNYDYVKEEHLKGGSLIMMFAKSGLRGQFKNLETSYKKTGFGGLWGNKGGVSIRFEMNSKSFALVSSHLPPHIENVADRVADYKTIVEKMTFKADRKLLNTDLVLWMGDLNFRIDTLTTDEVMNLIKKAKLSSDKMKASVKQLLTQDQLNKVQKEGKAFVGFVESTPNFLPTYKFIAGTDNYKSDQRKPAYTDRILYRVRTGVKGIQVRQKLYNSISQLKNSDHKPVVALYEVYMQ